jgi:hypothetical protein
VSGSGTASTSTSATCQLLGCLQVSRRARYDTLLFLITANAALAVMEYWGLTLVFWLIGLLGLWAVQVGMSAGGLQLEPPCSGLSRRRAGSRSR